MVTELDPRGLGAGGGSVDFAEHNAGARARKTMDGWVQPPSKLATSPLEKEWVDAINQAVTAAAATVTLLKGKEYRLVANTDCYIKMSVDGTAVTSSIGMLMPSGKVVYVATDKYHLVSVIRATADGVLSAVEMRK
jgi:flavin-binding protein dodecin